jgi:hypothetical protein
MSGTGTNTTTVQRLATLLAIAMMAAACTTNTDPSETNNATDGGAAEAASPNRTAHDPQQTTAAEDSAMTAIRITIAGDAVSAELADNPTARDLAGQLPLTLTFRDFNGVEKIAKLPRPLTMDGVPAGDDPEVADIGYYAPSQDIVFYYGDVGFWNGIVRIGRLNLASLDLIESQPDNFDVTLEQT